MMIKEAIEIAGELSKPSKMPGYSYGLPAEECITGSKLVDVEGSVCHGCYALKGFYALYAKTIKPSQYKHLEAINHPLWIEAMVTLIGKRCASEPFFRWHDSGDLQSFDHLGRIVAIAKALPNVHFWLPTREYAIVQRYLDREAFPSNLVVRVSAHKVDGPHPNLGNLPTSGVHTTQAPAGCFECPARKQDNKCGDCRACWQPSTVAVSYHVH